MLYVSYGRVGYFMQLNTAIGGSMNTFDGDKTLIDGEILVKYVNETKKV